MSGSRQNIPRFSILNSSKLIDLIGALQDLIENGVDPHTPVQVYDIDCCEHTDITGILYQSGVYLKFEIDE